MLRISGSVPSRKQTVSSLSRIKANDVSTQANNFLIKHLLAGSAADYIYRQTTTESELALDKSILTIGSPYIIAHSILLLP
jgi:hypothetical protein